MAAFVVKTVLECWKESPDFTYWGISDDTGEIILRNELFFGGLGMFAKGELPKPSYYAFYFLSCLGNELIEQGDNYIVTAEKENIQILLYNYCHFSDLYANSKSFNLTSRNRYVAFSDLCCNQFQLTLTHMTHPRYIVTTHRLNRDHGSVFDNWMAFGSLTPASEKEIRYLREVSQPAITKYKAQANNGELKFTPELDPFEVMLIELKPAGKE